MSADRCVCCGVIVPEGTMVCPACVAKANMNTNIASKKLLRSSEAAVIAKLQGPQIRALMEEHGIEVNGRRYILRERVRELIRAGETAKYRSISIWDTAVRLGRQRWKGAKKR